MRRALSVRSIALIAVGLAVASAVFCWRWALRYSVAVEKYEREVLAVESKQDELEYHLLNVAALVVKASEEPPRSRRIAPSDPQLVWACDDFASSLTLLRAFETARADKVLNWYYLQMKRRHFEKGGL